MGIGPERRGWGGGPFCKWALKFQASANIIAHLIFFFSYTGGSRCNSSGEYMKSWLKEGMNQTENVQEYSYFHSFLRVERGKHMSTVNSPRLDL